MDNAKEGINSLNVEINGLKLPLIKLSDFNRRPMMIIDHALIAPDELWSEIEKRLIETLAK